MPGSHARYVAHLGRGSADIDEEQEIEMQEQVADAIARDAGILEAFGMQVTRVDSGSCDIECVVPANLVNAGGFAHGSIIYSIIGDIVVTIVIKIMVVFFVLFNKVVALTFFCIVPPVHFLDLKRQIFLIILLSVFHYF